MDGWGMGDGGIDSLQAPDMVQGESNRVEDQLEAPMRMRHGLYCHCICLLGQRQPVR